VSGAQTPLPLIHPAGSIFGGAERGGKSNQCGDDWAVCGYYLGSHIKAHYTNKPRYKCIPSNTKGKLVMDFIDHLRILASRIASTKDMIQTEEATKNAMVMPLIQMLGYNVFDPLEVTPELVADVGTKKGEKVDYAILDRMLKYPTRMRGTLL